MEKQESPLRPSELLWAISGELSQITCNKVKNIYNCGTPGKTMHGLWISPQIDPALKIDSNNISTFLPGEKGIHERIIEKTLHKGVNAFVCIEDFLPDISKLSDKSINSGHYVYFSWPIDNKDNLYSSEDEFRIIITNLFFAFTGGMLDYKNGETVGEYVLSNDPIQNSVLVIEFRKNTQRNKKHEYQLKFWLTDDEIYQIPSLVDKVLYKLSLHGCNGDNDCFAENSFNIMNEYVKTIREIESLFGDNLLSKTRSYMYNKEDLSILINYANSKLSEENMVVLEGLVNRLMLSPFSIRTTMF